MIRTEDLWPALLDARQSLGRKRDTHEETLGWRFTRGPDGQWQFAASGASLSWSLGNDRLDCDLNQPLPKEIAAAMGFAARYLDLLWRQRAHAHSRPYTTACFAQSLDGFIATSDGDSRWIGNEANLIHAHRLRALHDGILVGCQTLLRDRPRLTVRRVSGEHPLRIVITRQEKLSDEFLAAIDGPTLVLKPVVGSEEDDSEEAVRAWNREHLQIATVEAGVEGEYLRPGSILETLWRRNIRSLMIEGGGVTVSLFQRAGLLDQADIQVAPLLLGEGVRPMVVDAAGSVAGATVHDAMVTALGRQALMTLLFH